MLLSTWKCTAGNRFCGRPPASSYIILSCGLLRAECTKQGAIYPNCLTVPRDAAAIAPPPGAATVSNSKPPPVMFPQLMSSVLLMIRGLIEG